MKRFSVHMTDVDGREREYILFAPSASAVREKLKREKKQVLSVQEKYGPFSRRRKEKNMTAERLSFFFNQTALLAATGISFVEAWKLLLSDVRNKKDAMRLKTCIAAMESGKSAAASMEETGLFPPLACNIMRAGERSGHVEEMLCLLGEYYKAAQEQQAQIRGIFIYPAFLFICIALLFFGAVFFILPVFAELFSEMGTPLPKGTRILLATGNFLRDYGAFVFSALVAAGISIYSALRRRRYREIGENLLFRAAWIRHVCLLWSWQRFSLILSVQMAGGIPILDAIQDAAAVIPLLTFRGHVHRMARCLENGMSFSDAVKTGRFGTSYVETMLKVGETTGDYDKVLRTISTYYGWRLQQLMSLIRKVTEPLILVFVGLVTGALVLGLLLPLLDMVTAVGE